MLSIFGNIYINDDLKFRHLKDSLASFKGISDNWVINVRGSKRDKVISYLKKELGNKLTLLSYLDDKKGWSNNALRMLDHVKHPFLLVWIEDHLNVAPLSLYKGIVDDMSKNNIDLLWYTWWHNGKYRNSFKNVKLNKHKYLDSLYLNKKIWSVINTPGHPYYLISLAGIFSTKFFKSLLLEDKKMFPYDYTLKLMSFINRIIHDFNLKQDHYQIFDLINKFSFYKFPKFPNFTPFNLEKEQYRQDWLPFRLGISRRELFASIDDDLFEPNYSLISRKKYKYVTPVKNKGVTQ